jgi:hypothetical protein
VTYCPIIYVRGYAGLQNEVEEAVDDPFCGFNTGSTHVRQDDSGEPEFYVFESPLIRLISDHGYAQMFSGLRQQLSDSCRDPLKTIWIHRYYDQTSRSFGPKNATRASIVDAASELKELIDSVRRQMEDWCARQNKPKFDPPPKFWLIAHSMGGLICRSLIQKIYPDAGLDPKNYIDKLFTFGTPHGGIHFAFPGGGLAEKLRDVVGAFGSDVFGREAMYRYLTPAAKLLPSPDPQFDPTAIDPEVFPPHRIFCVVGTDSRDYDVAAGASRTAVGPQSDGLVQIESASVSGSNRAYVHRSHSGRYGLVNSEESYQNLQRFLFGDVKVRAVLCNLNFDYATDPGVERTFFIETRAAVRNVPVSMHERTLDHLCALAFNREQYETQMQKGGLPLFTTFLISRNGLAGTMMYMLRVAVHQQDFKHGFASLTHHLDRLPLWSDYLVVELSPKQNGAQPGYKVSANWLSEGQDAPFREARAEPAADGRIDYVVPVLPRASEVLGPHAAIRLETSAWA